MSQIQGSTWEYFPRTNNQQGDSSKGLFLKLCSLDQNKNKTHLNQNSVTGIKAPALLAFKPWPSAQEVRTHTLEARGSAQRE